MAIGTAIANRNRMEVEPLVGFFINTLVLRAQFDWTMSVRGLLKHVREMVLGAYAHQELPFERLVEEIAPDRNIFRSPLFQVMLVMQNLVDTDLSLEELETTSLDISHDGPKFDLMLTIEERSDEIVGDLEFRTDLFSRATIERLGGHYLNVLEECSRNADQKIRAIKLTPKAEIARLIDMANPAVRPFSVECVHESFRRQAKKTPNAPAVEDDQSSCTYSELDKYSDRVAQNLERAGAGKGSLVAICLERGVEMVAAILGVLKAGAAYVPLDPNYPGDRLEFMLRDSGVVAIITDDRLAVSEFAACSVPKLVVGKLLSQPQESGKHLPGVSTFLSGCAY